jgi:hydrogenase 3 maturation protease
MKRMLLGVGNRLSGDDGAGPAVAESLESEGGWRAIDCGTSLENVSGIVAREHPDLLVVVDAARMGEPPGTIRRLPIVGSDRMLASTHGLPLSFVLERLGDAAGEVFLIGIEPEDLSLGARMSVVVRSAVDDLVSILRAGELWRIEGQEKPQG